MSIRKKPSFPRWVLPVGMVSLLAFILGAPLLKRATTSPPPVAPSYAIQTGRVARGQTLSSLFGSIGFSSHERRAASRALETVFSSSRMKEGDRFEVARSTDGAFAYLFYYENRTTRYRVTKSSAAFSAVKEEVPVRLQVAGLSGTLSHSLWVSMKAAGLSDDLIFRFSDIFAWQIDFLTEPRQGDRFRVVWERSEIEGKTSIDGRILAASYEGRGTGRHFAVLFKDPSGKEAYYDLEGLSMQKAFLRAPLQFRRISSRFTSRRRHPILRIFRPHYGIDYAAPIGTPVAAVGDGRVMEAGFDGASGRRVSIRHNATYESSYLHLRSIAKGIRPGAHVRQGQVIGTVGSSGLSTGPHLDFRMYINGSPVNFLKLRLPPAASVPGSDRTMFQGVKERMLALLGRVQPDARVAQIFSEDALRGLQ